ncbi:DUF4142 domain-containing protein [Bradyrhizobium sp. ARR65]|uniref:DUF4142 domain-containing protein n=1 Tax=Bradyrhizobium sp. ARR65 TaxID=1040989 RepID=UPI000AB0D379|nr:DUF4142 domain-containing protein [Bradyrhizobium sp. ARR65]
MIRLPAVTLLTVLLMPALVVPALAQPSNPAGPAPGNPAGLAPGTRESAPGVPASRQTNVPDRTFTREAAIGGAAEVDLAWLATQKASSRPVQEFAQQMIQDHGGANDRLSALAQADGIRLPAGLDAEHAAMRRQLEQANGTEFDRAYIQGQIIDHQKAAQLLEYEIGSGENAELKNFASDILPVVLRHLRMAQAVAAGLYGAAETSPRPQEQQKQ